VFLERLAALNAERYPQELDLYLARIAPLVPAAGLSSAKLNEALRAAGISISTEDLAAVIERGIAQGLLARGAKGRVVNLRAAVKEESGGPLFGGGKRRKKN
jgi:hypothetical protein